MDKLKELISKCKYGISITINEHKDHFKHVGEVLKELEIWGFNAASDEIVSKIINTNSIVYISFYFGDRKILYKIVHYDLDSAIDEALESVGQDRS